MSTGASSLSSVNSSRSCGDAPREFEAAAGRARQQRRAEQEARERVAEQARCQQEVFDQFRNLNVVVDITVRGCRSRLGRLQREGPQKDGAEEEQRLIER